MYMPASVRMQPMCILTSSFFFVKAKKITGGKVHNPAACFIYFYNLVSQRPQNTVSFAVPLNSLFPVIFSIAVLICVLVGP